MRKSRLAGLAATVAAVAVVGSAAAKPGPPPPPPPPHPAHVVGQVYIDDNTAPVNTVAGFDRLSDGTLAPIPGSPFVVGGSGKGKGNASQGSLALSDDGRYLLAVDAGSNQISVLRIEHDGSLELANGSPVSSNGVNPVSITVSHDLVFVGNQGPDVSPGDTNYTGFTLGHDGQLTPIPGSTYVVDGGAPAEVLFNHDGDRLVGTRVGSSQIDSFTVGRDGQLTPAPGSPYNAQAFDPPQGYGQLGSVFSPNGPDQLFVSDAHNAAGGGAPGLVSSFTVGHDGSLTPLGAPVANDGFASCWVEISRDGKYLFVVNTGSKTVSSYAVDNDGTLTFLQSTDPAALGGGAEDARLSPDGKTLWVVQAGANAVAGFSVDDGTLTPLTSAAGPAGATPTGIVVT